MTHAARIDWTEYERGWGNRPDGTTLHLDLPAANAFVKAYWERTKAHDGGRVPDEYSVPSEPRMVPVSAELHKRVVDEGSFWLKPSGWAPADLTA